MTHKYALQKTHLYTIGEMISSSRVEGNTTGIPGTYAQLVFILSEAHHSPDRWVGSFLGSFSSLVVTGTVLYVCL